MGQVATGVTEFAVGVVCVAAAVGLRRVRRGLVVWLVGSAGAAAVLHAVWSLAT